MGTSKSAFPRRLQPQNRDSTWANLGNALKCRCRAGGNFDVRGWYYTLYRGQWRGKRIIDIGSGLGYNAITFAGAGAVSIVHVMSTMSNTRMEEVARVSTGPRWFQLYICKDRGVTRSLVQRAEAAGFTALELTEEQRRRCSAQGGIAVQPLTN